MSHKKIKYMIQFCCILCIILLCSCSKEKKETDTNNANNNVNDTNNTNRTNDLQKLDYQGNLIESENEYLLKELRGCFDYFWEQTNSKVGSLGYGITKDNTREGEFDFGSIAATGYALAAYAIGTEYGYVTIDEARERALGTLKTFYDTVPNVNGFFYHFLHLSDGSRYEKVELSGIDTALFLAGAILAGEYFGGEVKEYADKIYQRVNWTWLVKKSNNRFYMAYDENGSGEFSFSDWDTYAEQFLMYILGAGSPTYPSSGDMFYSFDRWKDSYREYEFIRSWANSLFVYQYSHSYIDFRGTLDQEEVDWFENSVKATLAARQYCIDNPENSKTYHENSWGLSASMKKGGYEGLYGALPNGMPYGSPVSKNDGTIPMYGALASIVFTPEESLAALNHYASIPELWGRYGLTDCYNLDLEPAYYCPYYLGIDKGNTMVMFANYLDEFVWNYFMKSEYVKKGMQECGITKEK